MRHDLLTLPMLVLAVLCGSSPADAGPDPFVRLVALPVPRIVAAADPYPGGSFAADKLLDGNETTSYSSRSLGTKTYVEFDFGKPVLIAAFKHVDRQDPATIAGSQLTLIDENGHSVATVPVTHVNQSGGVTLFALPEPARARRVRWQVTRLGSIYTTVGAAEVVFYTQGDSDPVPAATSVKARLVPTVERTSHGHTQRMQVFVDYPYGRPIESTLHVEGLPSRKTTLRFGSQKFEFTIPEVASQRTLRIAIDHDGRTVAEQVVPLQPSRHLTIYLLPHSHTDIGYTQLQTEIEDKQVGNLLRGMEWAERTADYPRGARFVWNVEVLWAADLFLERLDDSQRRRFFHAVKRGQVELCGMYLNELTGLCRPEELMRLFRMATQLRQQTGAEIRSAMISDVPGYTWGTVTAMAQAGIKYFSVAPNYFDRVGDILVQWENKPFYWVGPSGREKVLVWIPFRGYATSHIYKALTPEFVDLYQAQLDESDYPYEVAYLRWSGHGDNAVPDPSICDFVKDWNARHEWPRFVISGVTEAFRALETRYGDQLPRVRGDWTPYWEDGAGSSARETAMNRQNADRMIQAEAVWALRSPRTYPALDFAAAWRNVLLYSEHTWGAWCSVSQPARRETREQWQIKRSYAVAADLRSRALLSRALEAGQNRADDAAVDVYNTTSWTRSDLVVIPKHLCEGRDRVVDDQGDPLPSQRLRSGELAFWADKVPALSVRRYVLQRGTPHVKGKVTVTDAVLDNGLLRVQLDKQTGGISQFHLHGIKQNLVDTGSGETLNDYRYLVGDNVADVQRNGPVEISVQEKGPLVASLRVKSLAPGCYQLIRDVTLVAGRDYIELTNLVDKQRLVATSYRAKEGKESVNFAFPFRVPKGQVRLHVPFGVIRPDTDQIPSACQNWFTVGRWADVSNPQFGVTWVTRDAPLVEVGGLTATLLNSQTNPDVWRKEVGPTQTLYAWAMNNHWGTNYRAYQDGLVRFRFALRPHRELDPAQASRLAIGLSQPLLPATAGAAHAKKDPLLLVEAPNVLVTGLKPSDDGKALIVRLWEAAGRDTHTRIKWSAPLPSRVFLSDLSERPREKLDRPVDLGAWSVVTLRAELP